MKVSDNPTFNEVEDAVFAFMTAEGFLHKHRADEVWSKVWAEEVPRLPAPPLYKACNAMAIYLTSFGESDDFSQRSCESPESTALWHHSWEVARDDLTGSSLNQEAAVVLQRAYGGDEFTFEQDRHNAS